MRRDRAYWQHSYLQLVTAWTQATGEDKRDLDRACRAAYRIYRRST